MSVPLILTVEKRLQQIGLAYSVFLVDNVLQDTHLARMTYFSAIKKEYVANPLSSKDDQKAVIEHIDLWISTTQQAMNDAMTDANVQQA